MQKYFIRMGAVILSLLIFYGCDAEYLLGVNLIWQPEKIPFIKDGEYGEYIDTCTKGRLFSVNSSINWDAATKTYLIRQYQASVYTDKTDYCEMSSPIIRVYTTRYKAIMLADNYCLFQSVDRYERSRNELYYVMLVKKEFGRLYICYAAPEIVSREIKKFGANLRHEKIYGAYVFRGQREKILEFFKASQNLFKSMNRYEFVHIDDVGS